MNQFNIKYSQVIQNILRLIANVDLNEIELRTAILEEIQTLHDNKNEDREIVL
jgi:hypothetical protein